MGSSAKGRLAKVGGADIFDVDLEILPDVPGGPLRLVAADYYWGSGVTAALPPVEIPYEWISYPLFRRPTDIINSAAVTKLSGSLTAYSSDDASIAQYGVGSRAVDLDTAVDADTENLAKFLTTYQAQPRPRQPVLRFNLIARTDAECLRILRVQLGQRVRVTGAPATWPPGAANFVVEGIFHNCKVDERFVDWSASAIVGTTATEPGPWFRLDASSWGGTDQRPF